MAGLAYFFSAKESDHNQKSAIKSTIIIAITISSFIPRYIFMTICKICLKKDYILLKQKLLLLKTSTLTETNKTKTLEKMLIVAEDHRFNYHFGIDIIAILRAIYRNKIWLKKEGASTIEQQLVRTLLQRYERTYLRKIKELCLAPTISLIVQKKEIPMLYLKVAYYGKNMFGYKSIQSYLNIGEEISIEAAAEIVSRIKYPQSTGNSVVEKKIKVRVSHLIRKFERKVL